MATLVLSAVGASIGGAVGGSILGMTSAVIGRAVGATVGRMIDQRLLGAGSPSVPTGRVDRFRLTSSGEGAAVGRIFGRVRIPGQVIWASRFLERVETTGGGGKGGGARAASSQYSYSVSLALALCEGEAARVGRIWADGQIVDRTTLNLRFYPGSIDQLPDPKIEAVEGADKAPAFRGTAYVVFEDLELAAFGNRVPQFTFEVLRRAQPTVGSGDPAELVKGVALIPGCGEYALATTPVHYDGGAGILTPANVNSPNGATDLLASLDDLLREVPSCRSVSLVVSWFGTDLRAAACDVRPEVERHESDGREMPWVVSGQGRAGAPLVSKKDGRPIYGGTPADQSVIEAIAALRGRGQEVMFYPFLLMDVPEGNALPDPWSELATQPALPWRGRITVSVAPGRNGSPDKTAEAVTEIDAFFGSAEVDDFAASGSSVLYSGPAEWSYRRFILHYAHLCALAGGVESFCIGSELRGLTHVRGDGGRFPAVEHLIALAADVRAILGPGTRIGYAADWSEYFGYHPQDGSGDVLFNLDPLWSDANIDFVGIDNYMPLSDWRDEAGHADCEHGSIYALDYLRANIEGGEGYDWYYPSETARAAQRREPIVDGAFGEDWVWRYKDIRNWWASEHFDRADGIRAPSATGWVPESKPIVFTEFGCPAIDKGTNQPNVFFDPKSSESAVPRFSNGRRDDLIQAQYLSAVISYWSDPAKNPVSSVYGKRMIDMDRAHVWAWDARPWPEYPGNTALWSDGENYARGHWLSGRFGAQSLGNVIAEICEDGGVVDVDVSRVHGQVRGMAISDVETARASLQPVLLTSGVDAAERGGTLRFRPAVEAPGRVRISFLAGDGKYEAASVEAIVPGQEFAAASGAEVPLVLNRDEAQGVVARWLTETHVARDAVSFALPPSLSQIGAGDVIALMPSLGGGLIRLDRIEDAGVRRLEGIRVERGVYEDADFAPESAVSSAFVPSVPVFPVFMDLPLMKGDGDPVAPHLAVTSVPWPGSVAVFSAAADAGYMVDRLVDRRATIGVTTTALTAAAPAQWARGGVLRVKLSSGALASADRVGVLNGANVAALGAPGETDGWEIFQFEQAVLVDEATYELKGLIRGQIGTEPNIPDAWPIGSLFVLLDGSVGQTTLDPSHRNYARHYRVGPAKLAYDHSRYVHEVHAFSGNGLRPYAPCHVRARVASDASVVVSWLRRTRIDGDNWDLEDVPLGEAVESYQVRVVKDGAIVRTASVTTPAWTYSPAERALDGATVPFGVEVAQVSDRFGPGYFNGVEIK
jgi:hypothetical protein